MMSMRTTLSLFFAVLAVSAQDPTAPQTPAPSRPADRLDQTVELLDLRETTFREALRLISEETGVNIVPSEEAGKKAISCFLQQITVRQAIETLSKTYGMWFKEDEASGVVRVMTSKEFERDLVAFRDERTQVFTLFFPNSVDVAVAIRNLFGSRVRLSLDRDLMSDEYQEILQRFQRFDLLEQRGQSLGVLGGGSNTTAFGQGGSAFSQNSGVNNFLRSTQGVDQYSNQNAFNQQATDRTRPDGRSSQGSAALTSDQIEMIEKALAKGEGEYDSSLLEKLRGTQTSIYVTIMRRNNMIAVRSADGAALKEIERIVRALDVPTPQVLLEVKILALDLGDDFSSAFDANYSTGGHNLRFQTGNIATGSGSFDPGSFVYQYVSDSFLSRLSLLQQKNRVVTLATPMLLVANNEVARLFVGEERPIVRNISGQTTVNQNSVTTTPQNTVEIRPVGTTLLITPNINADRTVTLRVLQETSDVREGGAAIPVITSTGSVINQPVDVVGSRSVSGTVIAKDGLTLALGGLVQEGMEVHEEGVPGLMDIPLLGALFRREAKSRTRQELVIMVRPYVLFTPTEGQEVSRQLADKLLAHPASPNGDPMDTFQKGEAPKPPLTSEPLKELLRYQSGLPGGN